MLAAPIKVPRRAKISRRTYPTFQRQKLAAEAMKDRTAKGEGGEVANLEEEDEEEMWAKLHRGLPADRPSQSRLSNAFFASSFR